MSEFVNKLIVTPLPDGKHWELLADFAYQDDVLGLITVPMDFVTDGGSVPPLFTNIISPTGMGFRPFVIHDWLYAVQTCSKEEADRCLLRALQSIGFNHLGEDVIYAAVRDGGQPAWDEDSKHVAEVRALQGDPKAGYENPA